MMGWYVYITVSFPCEDEHVASRLARQVLDNLRKQEKSDPDAYLSTSAEHFLEYVIAMKGVGHGHKGSVFTWGEVGNGPGREGFVDILAPFWKGLCDQEFPPRRVMVFMEPEQSKCATAYEIFPHAGHVLEFDCPFKWDQG